MCVCVGGGDRKLNFQTTTYVTVLTAAEKLDKSLSPLGCCEKRRSI